MSVLRGQAAASRSRHRVYMPTNGESELGEIVRRHRGWDGAGPPSLKMGPRNRQARGQARSSGTNLGRAFRHTPKCSGTLAAMHWLTRATPGPCRPISAIATFGTQYAPRNCSQYGCVEERKVSEYSSGGHTLQRYDKSKILTATSFPLRLGCRDWVGICLMSDILILDNGVTAPR